MICGSAVGSGAGTPGRSYSGAGGPGRESFLIGISLCDVEFKVRSKALETAR
jgi:hypothetical protein